MTDTIQTFPGGETFPADPESGNPAGYVREPDTLATGGFLPPDTPGADGATGKTPGALLAEDWIRGHLAAIAEASAGDLRGMARALTVGVGGYRRDPFPGEKAAIYARARELGIALGNDK